MEALTEHRLLRYFSSYATREESVSSEEMSSAYNDYKQLLSDLSVQPISILEKLRYFLYAKVELISLKGQMTGSDFLMESIFPLYLDKCLLLIEAEIELANFSIQHPQTNEASISFSSSLHWGGTLVNLMELISSLDYSKLVTDQNGKPFSFAGIVCAFEKLFNVSIPKPYDLRADLSRRKKSLSVLLPKLIEAYEKNIVNCGIGK